MGQPGAVGGAEIMVAGGNEGGNGGVDQGLMQSIDAVLAGRAVKHIAGKQQKIAAGVPAQVGDGHRQLQQRLFQIAHFLLRPPGKGRIQMQVSGVQ